MPPLAVQVTPMFVLPVTVEVNCWFPSDNTETFAGEIETEMGVGAGVGALTVSVIPAKVLLKAAVIVTEVSAVTFPVLTVTFADD